MAATEAPTRAPKEWVIGDAGAPPTASPLTASPAPAATTVWVGLAATEERVPAQSGQRIPTGVRTAQRGQIGLPQREQRSRVSTFG